MALPRAVQKQADEAERIEQELQQQQSPPEATTETPPTTPPAEVTPEPQPIEPEPVPAPVPAATHEEPWEQRYKSLQGKYNQQVPALQTQVKEASDAVSSLRVELELLKRERETKPTKPEQPLVTDTDVDAFGSDLIDLIERVARKSFGTISAGWAEEKKELLGQIAKLETSIGGVTERVVLSDQDRYVMALTQASPDWKTINEDPRFLDWLNVVDPLSGMARQTYLDYAAKNLNAQRTAEIFNAFVATIAPKPAPATNPLQGQVSPPRRASAPAVVQEPNTRIWTQQEVKDFYNNVARNRIPEAQAAATENEINIAASEGRIR